jgi:hypothetical protein
VGAQKGLSADDGVLATLSLSRKTAEPSAVSFDAARSTVLGDDGQPLGATFSGGALKRN